MKACLDGNQGAWTELVNRYGGRAYAVAYNLTGSREDAEELTQEVFVKLGSALKTFRRDAKLAPWLLRVTRNLCIDHLRRHRLESSLTVDGESSSDSSLPSVAERTPDRRFSPFRSARDRERSERVRKALQQVRPELREVVVLRDLQGYSYGEIASTLELPLGTVKSRINRGRVELARILRAELGDAVRTL